MNIKFTTKRLLVATMAAVATFSAINTNAQEVTNGNWYELTLAGTGNYATDANWYNTTSAKAGFVPAFGFFEWANISSVAGAHATVNSDIPGIVVNGNASNPMSLYVGYNTGDSGELTLSSGGILSVERESARTNADTSADNNNQNDAGWIVIGRQGTGVLNMNGGTLNGLPDVSGDQQDTWMMVGSFDGGGTGTLNMTSGTINMGDTSDPANAARLYIGRGAVQGGGTGTMNMTGGTINTGRFLSFGTGASHAHISGGTINTNDLFWTNQMTITGPNASINTNTITITDIATVNHVVTAGGGSAINVADSGSIAGTLNVDVSAAPASIGDSWTIINNTGAAVLGGGFTTVTSNSSIAGTAVRVNNAGGDGNDVVATLEKTLTLNINRDTGAATVVDINGGIEIAAYQILSASGGILSGNFNALGAGFDTVTVGVNEIVETNLTGNKTFGVGESFNLGNVFGKPLPVGQSVSIDTVELNYLDSADNIMKSANVAVEGTSNSVKLIVNKSTGEMTIVSDVAKDFDIAAYGIKSESGSLVAANAVSLDDAFDSGASNANAISESLLEGGVTLVSLSETSLGDAFDVAGTEDLVLELVIDGEGTARGNFVQDGSSLVDQADLDYVMANFDTLGLEALAAVRNNFGQVSEETRVITGIVEYDAGIVAAIPEPTTFALLGLSSFLLTSRRKNA